MSDELNGVFFQPYTTNPHIPDWIKAWLGVCIEALHIEHYEIQAHMVSEPGGSDRSAACVELTPRYLRALLEIDQYAVKDSDLGRHYLLHEMIHIALAPLQYLAETTAMQFPKRDRRVWAERYDDAQEQSVETLTRGLLPILIAWDKTRGKQEQSESEATSEPRH